MKNCLRFDGAAAVAAVAAVAVVVCLFLDAVFYFVTLSKLG